MVLPSVGEDVEMHGLFLVFGVVEEDNEEEEDPFRALLLIVPVAESETLC